MNYIIKNSALTVEINSKGAELMSIKNSNNTEFLWQGDAKYWAGRAPNLFPYIARLTDGKYTYAGKTYEMSKHGFARGMEFEVNEISRNEICFYITQTEDTLASYPFKFKFSIHYKLINNSLEVSYIIDNNDTKTMYFGLGGHPAFNVPFGDDGSFEDYRLEFSKKHTPRLVEFSDDLFLTGETSPYKLSGDDTINLTHDLFDIDAVILSDVDKKVTLKSPKSNNSLTVEYPDMDYLGIWHMPKTDAPYVCIEPWTSLPSRQDIIEDFEKQENLVSLDASKTYSNKIIFTID